MKKFVKPLLLIFMVLCLMGSQRQCFEQDPDIDTVLTDPAAPGDLILVVGDNFESSQGSSRLLYDGASLAVSYWSDGRIEATLPDPKPDGAYSVQVDVDGVYSNTVQHTICASCGCTPPTYNPGKWNDSSSIRSNNNCYNFGNDEITMTFAQPGRACGDQYHSLSCSEVHRAALCDGLVPISSGSDSCPDDMHRVYLVVAPNRDYHWYRQDLPDGMWSHKPGSTPATDRDGSGQLIYNPEVADTGWYTDHCGYLCACGDLAYIW